MKELFTAKLEKITGILQFFKIYDTSSLRVFVILARLSLALHLCAQKKENKKKEKMTFRCWLTTTVASVAFTTKLLVVSVDIVVAFRGVTF